MNSDQILKMNVDVMMSMTCCRENRDLESETKAILYRIRSDAVRSQLKKKRSENDEKSETFSFVSGVLRFVKSMCDQHECSDCQKTRRRR